MSLRVTGALEQLSYSSIEDYHRNDYQNTQKSPNPPNTLFVLTRENIHIM